jgi:beta-lactamase regulating signal transducer with metallopeptidase domain
LIEFLQTEAPRLAACLMHFLWQGLVGAVVAWFILVRFKAPGTRYGALCFLLGALGLAPILTYFICSSGVTERVLGVAWFSDADQSTLIALWLAGVGVGMVHLAFCGLVAVRSAQASLPIPSKIEALVRTWSERIGLTRPVRVIVRPTLDSPAVFGAWRFCLTLPLSVITKLSPEQLEAVIVHELVHIRRFDPLINLGQAFLERIYFFHPAVWWISRLIRIEREYCCDQETLAMLPDRRVYASGLARIEELRLRPVGRFVAAATEGDLVSRIARILGIPHREPLRLSLSGLGALIVATLAIFFFMGSKTVASERVDDPAKKSLDALWNQDQRLNEKTNRNAPKRLNGPALPMAPH